jgi:hypothetical protein
MLAWLAWPDVAAPATRVRCGDVIEERAVLDRELRCDGPALIVRNPRTVVQLNGHTIEAARACGENATTGILVEEAAEGAQILGPGTIRGFATGVSVSGTTRVQVGDLRVSDSCGYALAVRGGNRTRLRNLVLDRNGTTQGGGAVRVETVLGFVLEQSMLFLNSSEPNGATVDLRSCRRCRLTQNRIVANQGVGVRFDVESHGNEVERNVILDQRPNDVVDEGADNTFALNIFERGDGVTPPALWPLVDPGPAGPGVAGCGTLATPVGPRRTAVLACPQDSGLRALRNSVVAYRLLNPFTNLVFTAPCAPAEVRPATSAGGGAVTCTNPDSLWTAVLEVTCCLN